MARFLLAQDYSIENAVLLIGSGRNGKDIFIRTITEIRGDEESISAVSLKDIDKNSFAAFDLFGKIANINSEGSENLFKYTEKFKKFTGNSPIHAIIKHRDPITFYNQAKIIIMSEFFKKFILKFNGSKGEPKN